MQARGTVGLDSIEKNRNYWLQYANRATGSLGFIAGAEDDDEEDEEEEEDENFTIPELRREIRRLRKENARRRRENKDLKEERDKAQSEATSSDEKVQARLVELEKENAKLSSENTRLQADKALFSTVTSSGLKFKDPDIVMKMVDQDDFIDDDGEIDTKALKRELKALAKQYPYLLNSVEEDEEETEDEDGEIEEEEETEAPPRQVGRGDTGAGKKQKRLGSQQLEHQKKVDEYTKTLVESGAIPIPK